jgi:uncharacterized protein YecE (DUF72 family)
MDRTDLPLHIGTSGWNYNSWKDDFYAGVPRKRWLEFYASRFNALEIDGTFYHLIKPAVFDSWRARTPPQFCFALKGHRFITHVKRLNPPSQSIQLQRDNAAHLGDKLAAVLWQLPPNLHKNLERLEHFRELLDQWRNVRHVIEFRHESWFDNQTADLMSAARFAVCQSEAAAWPIWNAVTTDLVFIRLHGRKQTYVSNYGRPALKRWADRIRIWLSEGRTVHIYFDNDAKGYAPHNAQTLAKMLRGTEKNYQNK